MKSRKTDASYERLLDVIRVQAEVVKLGPDLGGVMALVAESARDLTHGDGAVVELAEGDVMVYRAAAGSMQPYLGLRLPRAASLSGLCVAEHRALTCPDCETDPRVDLAACRRVGLRSMVVVPLEHGGDAVGVLKVISREPHTFTAADVQVLGLMSDVIAAAMYHAAQHERGDFFFRATHDELTGMPNRAMFFDRLRQALERAQRGGERVGVLYVDMDRLKAINDRHGHAAGDAAIKECAHRLRRVSRRTDTAARLGGDEFALILPQVTDRASAVAHRQRLEHALAEPFAFRHQALGIAASIGIALYPDDAREPDLLLEAADRAMYTVKRARAK